MLFGIPPVLNLHLQTNPAFQTLIVQSKVDGRVHLTDFKRELAVIGLETGMIEVFCRTEGKFIPTPRNTPLPVHGVGQIIFVKHEDVKIPLGLDVMLLMDRAMYSQAQPAPAPLPLHQSGEVIDISSDEEEVSSSPSDRKGKGRAY